MISFFLVIHSLGVALLNLGITATTNETFFKTDGSITIVPGWCKLIFAIV